MAGLNSADPVEQSGGGCCAVCSSFQFYHVPRPIRSLSGPNKFTTRVLLQSPSRRMDQSSRRVAIPSGSRGNRVAVQILNVSDGSRVWSAVPDNDYGVPSATFSPDGSLLAVGAYSYSSFRGDVEIRRVSDGQLTCRVPAKTGALAFSPDGGALVTAWVDSIRQKTMVEFWRVSDGALMKSYNDLAPSNGTFSAVVFAIQGSWLVLGGNVTTTINQQTGPGGTITVIRVPVFFTELSRSPGGRNTIRWTGGPGPYQVQIASDLNGEWTNFGSPVTGNSAVVPTTDPVTFYRVVAPDL